MKTKPITKFLKKHQTPLLIAAGVLVAALIVWIFARNKTAKNDKENNDPSAITGTPVTPGIDFYELAERMLHAFIDGFGTDEEAVYAILGQLRTRADWVNLKRKYQEMWNEGSWLEKGIHQIVSWKTGNLPTDLKDELTKSELQRCRNILTANGITPDF